MIRSIRHFLLISLLISITIASSITAVGNYLLDKQVIQPYLDEQLIKIFSFIEILNQTALKDNTIQKRLNQYLDANHYESSQGQHLVFQVWSKKGKLLLHSSHTLDTSLIDAPTGFSDKEIKGGEWRIYAGYDPKIGAKIIIAELYDIRNQLADEITLNNAYILLVTYPIFILLVWVIVGIALRSITRVTSEISNRASTYLESVDESHTPIEIKPLVTELNHLFHRLKLAF